MSTRLTTPIIEKVPRVGVFFLEKTWSLGLEKSIIAYLSTTEVEYIVAGNNNSQLIWMKSMLQDYSVAQDVASSSMTLYCDNISVINISKNPVQHSRTKHIDIQHHFI